MKILIVDDHEIVRKGLISMLQCDEEIKSIEEADTIEEGIKRLIMQPMDVVFLDVNLGGVNGLDLIEQAKSHGLETKFIIFTSSGRKSDFERAQQLGVQGYILKDSNIEDILYGIKSISRGRQFYDAKMSQNQGQSMRDKVLDELTEREKEIFMHIGKGLSNLEIAEKLYISENTVKKHITSLMGKLGVKRRTEVALYATKLWRRKGDL